MYGKRELTIQNIRQLVSSYDLLSYYCEPFKEVNIRFCSELRNDKFPTCSVQAFKGKLFYKDFATGDSFDDIGYIQHKYNLNFKEALALINRDFKLGLASIEMEGMPTMQFFGVPDKTVDVNELVKESAKIKVQVRKWTQQDKDYWNGKYDFTSKQLEFYRIFPIKFFWMNDRLYSCKQNSYGYYLGKRDDIARWKIYQPLADKKIKWFSNIGKQDVQGYEQLPDKGEKLYITSSLKDVIVLRKLGLFAVAPSAESAPLDDEVLKELKQRFDHIVIFYDNDEAGIKASSKHSKLYEAEEICIPHKYLSQKIKDPSDFVEEYNYEMLKKIIEDEHIRNGRHSRST